MTDAELAILSLLSEGPSYDSELNSTLDERGIRKWTAIGYSSMYYVLDKLERQGLVERLAEQGTRRRYQISQAGVGVLQTAVSDLLSTPHPNDQYFELGLANLHILRPGQVHAALATRLQDIVSQLAWLRKEASATPLSFQINALYQHHITMLEAEQSWMENFIKDWAAQAPPEPETVIEPSIAPRSKQVVLPQDPDSVHKQTTRVGASVDSNVTPPAQRTLPLHDQQREKGNEDENKDS